MASCQPVLPLTKIKKGIIMSKRNEATLRLFNSVLKTTITPVSKESYVALLGRTIPKGYILEEGIIPTTELLETIESLVGISGEKANAAFHKSWKVVMESGLKSLAIQQMVHYITTYGFESAGIYSEDTVYIPNEKLILPEINVNFPLVMIKTITDTQLLSKIIKLGQGIALHQDTLADIMTIVEDIKYPPEFIGKIKNNELKSLLNDYYQIAPTNPVEFLRYVISKLTDESLLIKNKFLIDKIKNSNSKFLDELMLKAPDDLASIFLRYKPLFLAMKSISKNKTFYNRLRKKANKLHKPLPTNYLNSVTAQIKEDTLNGTELWDKLAGVTIFRKIKLAQALSYRASLTKEENPIVYRVRNGKGWASNFIWNKKLRRNTIDALDIVMGAIVLDIRENVVGKTVYIPENINYALPASEKQFVGFIPCGSYVSVPEDMVVGVHWTNTKNRVDLDLSLISENCKVGWDGKIRDKVLGIHYSGDVTDAPKPNGASELFYIEEKQTIPSIMMLNYFNFQDSDEVRAKLLVAHEKPDTLNKQYVVDVNNIIASTNIKIARKSNVLGCVVGVGDENRFYFSNSSIGKTRSAINNESIKQAREFYVKSLLNSLDFNDILRQAGARIVNTKPMNEEYIDLAPESLDKNTIIDLLQ